jgi:hypothetical protein
LQTPPPFASAAAVHSELDFFSFCLSGEEEVQSSSCRDEIRCSQFQVSVSVTGSERHCLRGCSRVVFVLPSVHPSPPKFPSSSRVCILAGLCDFFFSLMEIEESLVCLVMSGAVSWSHRLIDLCRLVADPVIPFSPGVPQAPAVKS